MTADRDDHDARMASNRRDNDADERDSRRKVPHQTAPKWRSNGVPAPDRAAEVRRLAVRDGLICPKCSGQEVTLAHHEGSWSAPECDYWVCGLLLGMVIGALIYWVLT